VCDIVLEDMMVTFLEGGGSPQTLCLCSPSQTGGYLVYSWSPSIVHAHVAPMPTLHLVMGMALFTPPIWCTPSIRHV